MGACCGKASGTRSGYGGDYQDADRAQLAAASEARLAKMENRGVTARGAAKLKAEATKKHTEPTMAQDTTMKWTMGNGGRAGTTPERVRSPIAPAKV